jgi:hypothetical protein
VVDSIVAGADVAGAWIGGAEVGEAAAGAQAVTSKVNNRLTINIFFITFFSFMAS